MVQKKKKAKKLVDNKVKDMSSYNDGDKVTTNIADVEDRTPDRVFEAHQAVRENEDGVLVRCEKKKRAEMEKSINEENERRRREDYPNYSHYSRVILSKSEVYITSRNSDYSGPTEKMVEVLDWVGKEGTSSDSESSSEGVGGGNAKKGSKVRGYGKRKRELSVESTSSVVSGKGGKAKKRSSGDNSYVDLT
jgi:hypothetical protein